MSRALEYLTTYVKGDLAVRELFRQIRGSHFSGDERAERAAREALDTRIQRRLNGMPRYSAVDVTIIARGLS